MWSSCRGIRQTCCHARVQIQFVVAAMARWMAERGETRPDVHQATPLNHQVQQNVWEVGFLWGVATQRLQRARNLAGLFMMFCTQEELKRPLAWGNQLHNADIFSLTSLKQCRDRTGRTGKFKPPSSSVGTQGRSEQGWHHFITEKLPTVRPTYAAFAAVLSTYVALEGVYWPIMAFKSRPSALFEWQSEFKRTSN